MLARVTTAALRGVDSYLVQVEVALSAGLPAFTVVGLPQGAVREGRERVSSALRAAGFPIPPRRVTVNLAPADVRKEGSAFDLPIAVGLLVASGHAPAAGLEDTGFLGELGLDGSLRPIRGALSAAARCAEAGLASLVVPEENAGEAAVVEGLRVLGVRSLSELREHLAGLGTLSAVRIDPRVLLEQAPNGGPDLREVRGQGMAKRALEIAAAGGHNLLMFGPPGTGKTMLARRLPGILPPPTLDEALEVTRVHSVAGLLPPGDALVARRPFRAPHHTVSDAGLVGGGTPPRPGEVSLAHCGVLFLDELAEFRRNVLESLRQPLEDGSVRLSRAHGVTSFPARFLMVGAMNPCPCGFHGDGSDRCLCDPTTVARYRARVSGPLRDRMDLQLEMSGVSYRHLSGSWPEESSQTVRARVVSARERQLERFGPGRRIHGNAYIGPRDVPLWCRTSSRARALLEEAVDRLGLSARGYHRILRVARTIADLAGCTDLDAEHVAEAVQYRVLDRRS